MPRQPRSAPGGEVYHVLNRAVGRIELFREPRDFEAFETVLAQAHGRCPIRILNYCLMPNHWHFVVWPRRDGELTAFFRWLTHTHAMRWRVAHHSVGYGPLYQGRFKSFPVQRDDHLLTVCRYVERNPLAAGVIRRAEKWRWGSLWVRREGRAEQRRLLSDWPVDRPRDWARLVNEPITPKELARLETSEKRGRPYGNDRWLSECVRKLRLEHTIRSEGRPKKSGT